MRDWGLRKDMNGDGLVSISDIWDLLSSLFYYPGDWITSKIIDTEFGVFFEFSMDDYGGFFSTVISLWFWLTLFYLPKTMLDDWKEKELIEETSQKKSDIIIKTNRNQKVIWAVYLASLPVSFFISFGIGINETIFLAYLFLGWIPFLIAHFIWRDKKHTPTSKEDTPKGTPE